jgi:hypothetical protein
VSGVKKILWSAYRSGSFTTCLALPKPGPYESLSIALISRDGKLYFYSISASDQSLLFAVRNEPDRVNTDRKIRLPLTK